MRQSLRDAFMQGPCRGGWTVGQGVDFTLEHEQATKQDRSQLLEVAVFGSGKLLDNIATAPSTSTASSSIAGTRATRTARLSAS